MPSPGNTAANRGRNLRQANSAQAQRLAHLVNYEFDVRKREVKWSNWSDATFRVLGRNPSNKAPTLEEYMQWVHPEDRDVSRPNRNVPFSSPVEVSPLVLLFVGL